MRRLLSALLSFLLVVTGLAATAVVTAPAASAAPLPAAFTASATGRVANIDTTLLLVPVVGLGVALSSSTADSGGTPRTAARSSNVSAAIAGLPLSVESGSQTAPPDNGTASTGSFLDVSAGILSVSGLDRSNLAHWQTDSTCVASGVLSTSTTKTAGVSVSGLLSTGAASSTTTTDLAPGSGPLNKAVRSTSTGTIAGITLLGGGANGVTISVDRDPTISAIASGSTGGATIQRNNPIVTVTANNSSTQLQIGATASTTVNTVAGQVSVALNPPTSVVAAPNGQTASATWNFLSVSVNPALGLTTVNATLQPMTVAATAPSGGIDCPPPAPVISVPAEGAVTSARPTLSGTATANATVNLTIDSAAAVQVTADGSGNWSYPVPAGSPLANGAHTATATQTVNGATSAASAVRNFTVDAVAPAAPVVLTPANGSSSNQNRPTYTGTAEANSTVTVLVDGASIGTTAANASGNWSLLQPGPLGDGSHTVRATATDAVGNVSPSSNTNTFTVDATAPAAPVVTAPANGATITTRTPAYTGTAEPNTTVTVIVDGTSIGTTPADASGNWTRNQPSSLADGSHTVRATATDAVGNVSPSSNTNTFTVDATAPAAPVVTAPADGATVGPRPVYTGTAEANSTVTVRVDGAVLGTAPVNASGTWSLPQPSALPEGQHTVSATATDAAGNTSPASATNTFTVDGTAPAAPVVLTPPDGSTTNDDTPTYTGTAEANATVTVRVDGASVGTTTATGSGAWSLTPSGALAEGEHTVSATATDAAGNVSPSSATNTFTVDTTAPQAPTVITPATGSRTNDRTPVYTGTAEADATVAVIVDGSVVGTTTATGTGSWTYEQPGALADGSHTVRARATDAAGNTSTDSNTNTFTVDATAPAAPVVTDPTSGETVAPKPTYSGTAEANSTVTVSVDGTVVGTTTASGTGDWSLDQPTALANGAHSVSATATDAAGNTSPASTAVPFTVDAIAPDAPVVLTPANGSTTNDDTPTYTGTAEPNSTVTVSVDGAPIGSTTATGTGDWSLTQITPLSDATHTVSATATDAVGNVSAPSALNAFTVDTVRPLPPTVSTPANGATTASRTPTYTGTAEAGSTVTVIVDGSSVGTTTATSGGSWTLVQPSALTDGSHAVRATATDAAGNVSLSSDTNTFTVDATAPAAPVITDPTSGETVAARPTYTGTAEAGSTVTVRVDGTVIGTTTATGTGDWSLLQPTALAGGAHSVSATATDAVGNVSAPSATVPFTVDATAPAAPVITAPTNGGLTDGTPTYAGTAEPNSTVTVRVDGTVIGTAPVNGSGTWSLPQPTTLPDGTHTVQATATDAVGNTSPASTPVTFTVDTTAPVQPTVVTPANGSATDDTTPTYTGTAEALSTVEVVVDGVSIGSTTATAGGLWTLVQPTALVVGPHFVAATSRDAAGNFSLPSNTSVFTVTPAAPDAPLIVSPAQGALTNDRTPAYTGTAAPGALVTVTVDGVVLGATTASSTGTWSYTQNPALPDGPHTVSATATVGGLTSQPSPDRSFTVDSTAPGKPVVQRPANGALVADRTPTYSGTAEAGSLVTVRVDGAVVATTTTTAAGTWSVDQPSSLADGSHSVYATATDAAGNVSVPSNTNTFRIDGTPPAMPTLSAPVTGSRLRTTGPVLSGTGEPGAVVSVREGAATRWCTATVASTGRWSCTPTAVLAQGFHTFTATQRDAAGNVSVAGSMSSVLVDTQAPAAPRVTSPSSNYPNVVGTVLVQGTAGPGTTITIAVRNGKTLGTAKANAAGMWTYSLAQRTATSVTITARQTDVNGNVSAWATGTTVRTVAATSVPVRAPRLTSPATSAAVKTRTPRITGTGQPGARIDVTNEIGAKVGSTTVASNGSWAVTVVRATDTVHRYTATQTTKSGSRTYTLRANTIQIRTDEAPPAAPKLVVGGAGTTVDSVRPVFGGTTEAGATVRLAVGATQLGSVVADDQGRWILRIAGSIPKGTVSIRASVLDEAGWASPTAVVAVTSR